MKTLVLVRKDLEKLEKLEKVVAILLVGLLIVVMNAQVSAAAPSTAPAGSSFNDRLALRKQEQNVQLDTAATRHLQQTCTNAQSVLRAKQSSYVTSITKRNDAFNKIDSYLWVTIGQLKLGNQPTFNLEQQRASLAEKSLAFQTTGANYQQAIDDLLVINCQSDPVGFQALLNTARAFYTQMATDSQAVRDYTVNTVKPTLQTAIDTLNNPASTTDSTGGGN